MNPETHTCDCGFTWRTGRSGAHSCGPHYRKTIAVLCAAAAPQVVADERDPDDSVLVCASDLQHSAIFDNHEEARGCMNAIALRLKALAAAPVQAQEPDHAAEMAKVRRDVEAMGYGFLVDDVRVPMSRITWFNRPGEKELPASPLPAPVQPVAVPDGLSKAFVTLESHGGRYSIVMKFNQKADAFVVHDFLLGAGGKEYNSAAPAAQGEAISQQQIAEIIDSYTDQGTKETSIDDAAEAILAAIAAKAAS